MKIPFAHLCDYATVSQEGKLSILGIFTNINAAKFPATHPQMYLAFDLEMKAVEVERQTQIEIHLVDADGEKLFEMKGRVRFRVPEGTTAKPGVSVRVSQIMVMSGIKFKRPGAHDINIFLNGPLAYTVSFNLTRRELPVGDPPAAQ